MNKLGYIPTIKETSQSSVALPPKLLPPKLGLLNPQRHTNENEEWYYLIRKVTIFCYTIMLIGLALHHGTNSYITTHLESIHIVGLNCPLQQPIPPLVSPTEVLLTLFVFHMGQIFLILISYPHLKQILDPYFWQILVSSAYLLTRIGP